MRRRFRVILVALSVTGIAVSSSSAQVEKNVGLGVDVENQSFELLGFSATGSPFFTLGHTSLTPCFQLSFRASPNVFVEPSFGWHRDTDETTEMGSPVDLTQKTTQQDIKVGLGLMYLTNPTQFVSPYVRGKVDFHFLNAKDEEDVSFPTTGTDVMEVSATALVAAASLGGIINIREAVFIMVEARFMYAHVGDADEKRGGPNYSSGFSDTTDTKSTRMATDMIIGMRVMIF